jgi:acetylornithine deacetylase/succinyl-diaminopimelate desuccinylase-like protein
MLRAMAAASPWPVRLGLRLMLIPALTDVLLHLLGPLAGELEPMLHNVAQANTIRGFERGGIRVQTDIGVVGKVLPGFGPDDLTKEIRALLGPDIEIAVTSFHPTPSQPDMGLYDTLAAILRQADPDGTPIPYMASFATDGRFFSRLGIQHYGFTPMKLPGHIRVAMLAHGIDERIPVEALRFGADAIYALLQRYSA